MSRLRIFNDADPSTILSATQDHAEIAAELGKVGVHFQRWKTATPPPDGASPEEIMAAYRTEIDHLIATKGFQSVDVVSITPSNPNRNALRAKFLSEHSHKEDEVRFFVAGSGLFSLHMNDKVYEVLCVEGDLISVPDGALHWFDMGPSPFFTAIRFFTAADGWVGYFTGNDIADRFPRFEEGQAV